MKRKPEILCTLLAGCIFLFASQVLAAAKGSDALVHENIERLTKTKSCKHCDLHGANLNRMQLAGADLEGADLSRAKLYLADLSGANLKDCSLQGAGFGGTDLAHADLRGADLRGVSLAGAYTVGARFDAHYKAQTQHAQAAEAAAQELSSSVQTTEQQGSENTAETGQRTASVDATSDAGQEKAGTDLSVVKGDHAAPALVANAESAPAPKTVQPMQVVKVAETASPAGDQPSEEKKEQTSEPSTTVGQAPAMNTEAPAAVTVEKQKAAPQATSSVVGQSGGDAAGTVSAAKDEAKKRLLSTKQCYGCDLSGLDLSDASLEKADLEEADLSGCNLAGVDLEDSNLKGATIVHANLQNANLRGVDFYEADLSGTDLSGADLKEAVFEDTRLEGVIGLPAK